MDDFCSAPLCDHGRYVEDATTGRERWVPCEVQATHRYFSPGMPLGRWGHRCATDAALLDASLCRIERLAVAS